MALVSPPEGPSRWPADPWAGLGRSVAQAFSVALGAAGAAAPPEALRDLLDTAGGDDWDVALAVHRFAKTVGRSPDELASEIARSLVRPAGILSAVPKAGYVNLRVDPVPLADATLGAVFERGERYGGAEPTGLSVCVEHTSANATGPFHVGRVRNAIIGDTLTRILRAAGHQVTSQYYVDDMGRQAAMITWIWSKPRAEWPEEVRGAAPEEALPGESDPRPDRTLGRPYPAVAAYLKGHPDADREVTALVQDLEQGRPPLEHHRLTERILRGMLASLQRINIGFDEFVWESTFLTDGSVAEVVRRLRAAPHAIVEANGARAIDAATYHLPKEDARIIVTRADGTTLYVTRDVAYHLAKMARFPRVIDVLGQDHLLHAKTLIALLTELGEARAPEFILYQYVVLPDGGKMSTRQGTAVFLDDLLDEAVDRARKEILARRDDLAVADVDAIAAKLGASAVRYHIARVAPDKAVRFTWEDALSFEGRTGPFVQYSYARASSILRKASAAPSGWTGRAQEISTPPEQALVRSISRLPGLVAYAARTAHVHTIAGYAHDLAETFNRFYQDVPVLRAEVERESRLALVHAARQTLGNTLDLLGLDRLEAM
ncbi:MAG: arginine--tRNA ligase [Thermoplasmata archaeon]|nr:arginine--tRNA ligase [Thermoplasmata archaeon]